MSERVFNAYFKKECESKEQRKVPRIIHIVSGPSVPRHRKQDIIEGIESLAEEMTWDLKVIDDEKGKDLDEFLRQHKNHRSLAGLVRTYAISQCRFENEAYMFIANEECIENGRKEFHKGYMAESVFFIRGLNPDFDSLSPKLLVARMAGLEAIHDLNNTAYFRTIGNLAPKVDCLNYYSPLARTLCDEGHDAFAGSLAGQMVRDRKNYFAIRRKPKG